MPRFSQRSLDRLETCDERLQRIFTEVIRITDCTVLDGHRGRERQNELYASGASQLRYPRSKHNGLPSLAVDVAPYPLDWDDLPRFYRFAGVVFGVAGMLDIPLRWGGDWDRDWDLKDNRFNDLPHFEIYDEVTA